MKRFTVLVSEEELKALKMVAEKELRDFRIQARLLIKGELENRGLLEPEKNEKIQKVEVRNGAKN